MAVNRGRMEFTIRVIIVAAEFRFDVSMKTQRAHVSRSAAPQRRATLQPGPNCLRSQVGLPVPSCPFIKLSFDDVSLEREREREKGPTSPFLKIELSSNLVVRHA